MKKIKRVNQIIFISVFLVFSLNTIGQNTWQTAQTITHGTNSYTINSQYSEYWFTFTANTDLISATAEPIATSNAIITNIELFDVNIAPITNSNDTPTSIFSNSITIGNTYYIKVINSDPSGQWKLMLTGILTIVYPTHEKCPPACDNLVFNGDFEEVFWPVVQHPGNYNNLALNPFGQAWDNMMYVNSTPKLFQHMVCGWRKAASSPQISQINGSGAAYMYYGSTVGNQPEAIYTNVFLKAWTPYIINFDYTLYNTSSLPGAMVYMSPNFSINQGNLGQSIQNIQVLFGNTASTTIFTPNSTNGILFTPTADCYSLVIQPQQPNSGVTHFQIDNITITTAAPPEPPIITGPTTTCGSNPATYTITNYDPVYVYQYTINGGPIKIAHSNIITINWSTINNLQQVNTIHIENWCEDYTDFLVFDCCDPYPTNNADHYYCDGDIISSPYTFLNKDISICGFLYIGANVTINLSDVKFCPMSGIKVLPGYTLTINNVDFKAGCNFLWDGIYAEDPTSSIIISNSFFEHAKNAVVGANNANINITSSEFKDNQIGVKIRNYNPECEMVAWPDPPDPPPPANNTYIAGCTFKRSTASMPASLDPYYYYNFTGVQIDTVYDITIGDYSSAILKNTFDNLVFGIKSINSELQVYNNEFNNISKTEAVPLIDSDNHPLEGAVHCTKPVYAVGTIPPVSTYVSCITNDLIVGGLGLKKNVFNSCNFGVFTYKHSLTSEYNEFNNQYFNAIYDYLSIGISHINNNIIKQCSTIWAPANKTILNSAIRMESAFKSLAGKDLEILNNTINNTRTGIAVINATSSLPGASNPRYAKIGSNKIYFDNFDPYGTNKYYGINIQDCDRIRVAGNHIKNNSGNNINGFFYRLQGIHVAQSTGAWVYDNHQIIKAGYGIYAVGVCTNTQFLCNDLVSCENGFYFEPQYDPPSGGGTVATFITQQGHSNKASDNIWISNFGDRIAGNLNQATMVDWYFRGNHDSQPYSPYLDPNKPIYLRINPIPNINVGQCAGLPMPIEDDDPDAAMRNQRLGAIVREEISYDILDDEFEDFNEDYLFEILYSDPDLMYLGGVDDTAYINFYNYRVNSTIAEFIEIQELIDEGDINQALMDNGVVVAQTVIEVNKQVTNDVYLNALAQDIEFDQTQRQALLAIASLTPYVGGEGVYSARVMLGLDPDDLNLPYRKARPQEENKIAIEGLHIYPNPTKDEITIELTNEELSGKAKLLIYSSIGNKVLEQEIDTEQNIHTINFENLQAGVYFYNFIGNKTYKGKIIIMD